VFGLILTLTEWATAACTAPYARVTLEHDLGVAEAAMQSGDPDGAGDLLRAAAAQLECAESLIDGASLARFARLSGLIAFFDQDEPGAVRWALAARYADADLAWPPWIPEDHPFRGLAAAAENPPVGTVPGKALLVPRRGGVFWNGHLLLEPRARAEVPGFVQVIDARERPLRSYWQDGAAFPDEILVPGPAERLRAPPWWSGEVPEVAEVREAKGGGGSPVGAIVAASLAAVAGGALYGLAAMTAADLPDATSIDDAAATRTRANALVLAAGAAGATAVGATIGAVAADAVGVGLRVRF
jgi:hypothetical protein